MVFPRFFCLFPCFVCFFLNDFLIYLFFYLWNMSYQLAKRNHTNLLRGSEVSVLVKGV